MSLSRKPNAPSTTSISLPTPANLSISNVSSTASPSVSCFLSLFILSTFSFGSPDHACRNCCSGIVSTRC
jgi:hypothetical protein